MVKLTTKGKKTVNEFISSLKVKQRELLDAKYDTADETDLPTEKDIITEIEYFEEVNESGEIEYYNSWGVTDHYNSDRPLSLIRGIDYVEVTA